jgi:hypothetical protein
MDETALALSGAMLALDQVEDMSAKNVGLGRGMANVERSQIKVISAKLNGPVAIAQCCRK